MTRVTGSACLVCGSVMVNRQCGACLSFENWSVEHRRARAAMGANLGLRSTGNTFSAPDPEREERLKEAAARALDAIIRSPEPRLSFRHRISLVREAIARELREDGHISWEKVSRALDWLDRSEEQA